MSRSLTVRKRMAENLRYIQTPLEARFGSTIKRTTGPLELQP